MERKYFKVRSCDLPQELAAKDKYAGIIEIIDFLESEYDAEFVQYIDVVGTSANLGFAELIAMGVVEFPNFYIMRKRDGAGQEK